MRGFGVASAVAAGITATSFFMSSVVAQTVDPIIIKGSKFFYKTNGTQFYIRGVAYQQDYTGNNTSAGSTSSYVDPLADPAGCTRDLPYLQELRTNTLRVYAIDPTQDHTECMTTFANAGIYVIADLSAPDTSINRADPQWNDELYARYAQVVDAMANYTNTLGFFAGNEVSNANNNTDASAFVKAAVRDMKAYIVKQGYRTIGVGYATDDDASIRVNLADYFNCGDQTDAIDFWGYNIYSWCGSDSSFETSGYADRTKEFESYSVPAFFAEYGCNNPEPRQFDDTPVLFGPQMENVWSGGIVYMYFQEANDYGLVSVSGNSVSKLPDFTQLSSKIASASPTGVNAASYSPTNSPAACPSIGANWNASSNLPPTPNQELCSCMYSSLTCIVKPGVSDSKYGDLFGYIAGQNPNALKGVMADSSSGTYGAYGMCNATEQLGFVFNQYYSAQPSASRASACNFGGAGMTQSPSAPSGTCASLIKQAGTAGTGTVTSQPSGTGANGAGASGASAASSSGAAGIMTVPHVETGLLPMAFIVTLAALSGVGMILL